jgi:AcrR family transcriptional regulator
VELVTELPTLRADARRNRDAIVNAAREAFAMHGLQTSLDDIAKCAGVGSGTLYRHFPKRDDLVAAVFTERMDELARAVDEALRDENPWRGFTVYVKRVCQAQAEDQGLAAIFAVGQGGEELADLRNRAYEGFNELIAAAKKSGELREDFTAEDIAALLMANAGIIERAGTVASDASERFVALALDGFRANGATPAPPAVSPRRLLTALRRSDPGR